MKSDCVLWKGYCDPEGYGRINRDGVAQYAHRYFYEMFKGRIPSGICVLHECDVPSCVNLSHLYLGTQTQNVQDMDSKGRRGRPNVKLSVERINEIILLHSVGYATAELSKIFGVTPQHINRLVRQNDSDGNNT